MSAETGKQGGVFDQYSSKLRSSIAQGDATKLGLLLRICNVIICGGMIAAVVIYGLNNSIGVSNIVSLVYVVMFSLLFIIYEIRLKFALVPISKYFGFLFNWSGRTIFMLFLGSLCLTLGTEGIVAGSFCYAVMVFNVYVLCVNRDLSAQVKAEGKDFRDAALDAAYRGGKQAAQTGAQYAKDNPDKVAKVAAENPELVKAAASGAYGAVSSGAEEPSEGV